MNKNRYLVHAAFIAAVYAVLTIAFAPLSYGQIQVRFAEALTVLPFFTPAAVPGLFVGCIVANFFGTGGILDVVFGSIATLIAAYLSSKMPAKWLVPLPPIIVNGVIIGFLLNYLYQLPLLITMGWVALGELIACYAIGYPLMVLLEKYRDKIFS
ncbi:MAG TPA: QueT transporter family protein [Negativicutes bacterium]|nr:QueT transporter family protein [Negativicutes bacterium]